MPEVEVKDVPEDPRSFELHPRPGVQQQPIRLSTHKEQVKQTWLREIRQQDGDVESLAAGDDLQVSDTNDNEMSSQQQQRKYSSTTRSSKLVEGESGSKTLDATV